MNKNRIITHKEQNCILNIDLDIKEEGWLKHESELSDIILKTSLEVFRSINLFAFVTDIEFSLILAENNFIQNLNSKYRSKDKPTNCLSFPLGNLKPQKLNEKTFLNHFAVLGDIIFSYDIISQEAEDQNKEFFDHFSHLLVHSLLHLFGYDHEVKKEAEVMEKLEVDILKTLSIKSPYE